MKKINKLIKEIDRRIEIETATLDDCPVREQSEEWVAMLTEIKGIVKEYPRVFEMWKSACYDLSVYERKMIKLEQPPPLDDDLVEDGVVIEKIITAVMRVKSMAYSYDWLRAEIRKLLPPRQPPRVNYDFIERVKAKRVVKQPPPPDDDLAWNIKWFLAVSEVIIDEFERKGKAQWDFLTKKQVDILAEISKLLQSRQPGPIDDDLIKKTLKVGIALSEEINNIDHFAPGPTVSQSGYDEAKKEVQKITKEAEEEIRKLLSRQPEKVTVTREEIETLFKRLEVNVGVHKYQSGVTAYLSRNVINILEEVFKSKNIKVVEK